MLGPEQLQVVRARLEECSERQADLAVSAEATRAQPDWWMVHALSRLKSWHWSVFLAALGCGAAVAIVGFIDLAWDARAVLGGLGSIAVVMFVHTRTRHLHAEEEDWIAS
jgi:hypothetical protein